MILVEIFMDIDKEVGSRLADKAIHELTIVCIRLNRVCKQHKKDRQQLVERMKMLHVALNPAAIFIISRNRNVTTSRERAILENVRLDDAIIAIILGYIQREKDRITILAEEIVAHRLSLPHRTQKAREKNHALADRLAERRRPAKRFIARMHVILRDI